MFLYHTCPLHTNSGRGKERLVKPEKAAPVNRTILKTTGPVYIHTYIYAYIEGDGLRAEGETMDGRDQTPSGMGSGVDLELYVDSDFASRDTNRRSVPGGVVICAGTCVSFVF